MKTSKPALSTKINSSKDLGAHIKQRRLDSGLVIEQAAAMCNVGARFLFEIENGKPSVHFAKALEVARRFGIRLEIASATEQNDSQDMSATNLIEMRAPHYDSGDWLSARVIASGAARECGLSICDHTVDQATDRIVVTLPKTAQELLRFKGQSANREEEGGPSYQTIFAALDMMSSRPLLDIAQVIRWAVFSYLIGDTDTSGADIRIMKTRTGWRLTPFLLASCSTSATRHRGLRIGGAWPIDWPRADHWTLFATHAKVRPKLVFTIMEELSGVVPSLIQSHAKHHTRSSALRGAIADMHRAVEARAARVKEILMSAGHQGVAGVKKAAVTTASSISPSEAPYTGHETVYDR